MNKISFRLNDNGINYSDNYMWRSTKCSKPYLTYFRHLKHFHESPIIKYAYNSVGYLFFLLLFSYYLLFQFQMPQNDKITLHWTEIFVIITVTTMLIEEIRQVNENCVELLDINSEFLVSLSR